MKYGTRQARQDRWYRQPSDTVVLSEGLADCTVDRTPMVELTTERARPRWTGSRWNLDDILMYVDNEESRSLCRLVIECDGNISARGRLGLSEGRCVIGWKPLGPNPDRGGVRPVRTRRCDVTATMMQDVLEVQADLLLQPRRWT